LADEDLAADLAAAKSQIVIPTDELAFRMRARLLFLQMSFHDAERKNASRHAQGSNQAAVTYIYM
jgi:hypothetical protein